MHLLQRSPVTSGQFQPIVKESVISSLIKKSTLDKAELSNYCPISNLSVISKITKRVDTNYLILTSLPTVNIIQLKLLCSTFTIISLMQ